MLLWDRSLVFSSLAAGNNKSFLLSIFDLVVYIGSNPQRRETSFGVTLPLPRPSHHTNRLLLITGSWVPAERTPRPDSLWDSGLREVQCPEGRWNLGLCQPTFLGDMTHSPAPSAYSVTKSCLTLCGPLDCSPSASSTHGISQQEYWNGLPFLSPRDLPNPGTEPLSLALLYCRQILYSLSCRGSPSS